LSYYQTTQTGVKQMQEILLYGLAKDATESYMEDLLATNCKNEQDIEKVIAVAKQHGFHSFRVAYYNGEKPDFTKVLNK
jgi:hypothetical protein